MTAENSSASRYHIPSLDRGLRVMEYLAHHPHGATLTEIVDALDTPKNSVFRITTTLLDNGYLTRHEESMRFKLTKKFLAFGLTAVSEQDIIQNSIDVMKELRDVTDTTALLGTICGSEGVILEQAPGGHPFKLCVDLGTRFYLHSGAPGKAMLAFLPTKECEALMKKMKFVKFNEHTITNIEDFHRELQTIRECGYSIDRAEQFESVHCVGAPLFDQSGSVVGSLWISGQASVLPIEKFDEYGPIVKEHASRISKRLGYQPLA